MSTFKKGMKYITKCGNIAIISDLFKDNEGKEIFKGIILGTGITIPLRCTWDRKTGKAISKRLCMFDLTPVIQNEPS